jgi:transposase InsO family protein
MCSIANISYSGYYYWKRTKDNQRAKDKYLLDLIKNIFYKTKCKVGFRAVTMALRIEFGIIVNHKKVQRIKNEYGLHTLIRRKNPYREMIRKQREHLAHSNILNRKFTVLKPDVCYSTDITYLFLNNGQKAFLSATKDLATKEVVYYNLSSNIDLRLALEGVREYLLNLPQDIRQNLLIHSDQGMHYTSRTYNLLLKELGVTQSMSRKGNCWDNAPIESFFGHMKDEVEFKDIKSITELKKIIDNYMNYYNNKRGQWNLKKMTPKAYRNYLLNP